MKLHSQLTVLYTFNFVFFFPSMIFSYCRLFIRIFFFLVVVSRKLTLCITCAYGYVVIVYKVILPFTTNQFSKNNTNILEVIASNATLLTFNENISIYENPQPKFFIKNIFIMKEDFLRESIILNIKREITTKFCTKSIIYDLLGIKTIIEFHFNR